MIIWNSIYGSPKTNHSFCDFGGTRLRRKFRVYSGRTLLLACMTGTFSSAIAAQDEQNESASDLEFLEFLGQFETDAGEWINPDSLLTEEFTELLEASTEANADDNSPNDATNDKQ